MGQDINLTGATTVTGAGVKTAVLDTGLEIAHPDLSGNVVTGSYNFLNGTSDPTNPTTNGDHGTSVAGLIGMVADNSIGGRGVASGVFLVGFNFLQLGTNLNLIASLGGSGASPDSASVFVFNQSFGIPTTDELTVDPGVENQMIAGVTNLRGTLGALYVKSAGNGFDGYGSGWACTPGITCENANFDPYNAIPWNIVVGAMDADGLRSSYSTAGSAIWVSAPGGEFGFDVNQGWAPWPTNPAAAFEPAMVTTDQSGCGQGYSQSTFLQLAPNPFEDGDPSLNPNCDYTSTFNGTSSAAPVTVGVIALMLEANPALTWRDVKHILATTADNTVDASGGAITASLGNGTYNAELGWVPNAAGYKFSNWYGFGRVDADAAVALATGYPATNTWPALVDTNPTWNAPKTVNGSIPNNSVTGVSDSITLSITGITFIEAVQIQVTVTHNYIGAVGIELTSPGGTKSILLNVGNGFNTPNLSGMVLLSNAFYGEGADGTWTIKVVDADSTADNGVLNSWQIRVYGH